MATWKPIEPGPIGCEWFDVLHVKDWTYKERPYRSLKVMPGVHYFTVSPVTGEICDFEPAKGDNKKGQLSLFE